MTIQLSKTEEARILRDRRAQERRDIAKARRRVSPKATRGRVIDKPYLQWLRLQPCAAQVLGDCSGPIEAAHLRYSDASTGRINPGLQTKPSDFLATPLCTGHHRTGPRAQHSMGERKFWEMVGVNPATLCQALLETYNSTAPLNVSRRDGADKGGGA